MKMARVILPVLAAVAMTAPVTAAHAVAPVAVMVDAGVFAPPVAEISPDGTLTVVNAAPDLTFHQYKITCSGTTYGDERIASGDTFGFTSWPSGLLSLCVITSDSSQFAIGVIVVADPV